MKIRVSDWGQAKAYIQRYDLYFLLCRPEEVPKHFTSEALTMLRNDMFFLGPLDGLTFDCVFEDPKNVDWIMSQNYILDYKKYVNMSKKEIKSIFNKLLKEYNHSVDVFNFEDSTYRMEHFHDFSRKAERMKHQLQSTEAMLDFKRNKLRFVFPHELTEVL